MAIEEVIKWSLGGLPREMRQRSIFHWGAGFWVLVLNTWCEMFFRSVMQVRCFRSLMFPGENASCKHRIIARRFARNRRFLFAPAH